ncbi:hypothetical protein Tco_0879946 [Tanacetum coccineum]
MGLTTRFGVWGYARFRDPNVRTYCIRDFIRGVKSNDELEAPDATPQSPRQAPPSPDYVHGPEHPPSPDYVLGPKEPEQPLPNDASPTALSPGYVADSNLEEDPKEDLEEDPAHYPADGGDNVDDESSDDDDNEEEEEQEASKDDDEEEEEHPAIADSSVVPVDDLVPLAKDTEAF